VKSNALLFAHFERSDLEAAENYRHDFGLVRAAKTVINCSCAAALRGHGRSISTTDFSGAPISLKNNFK
jgi:hypothetical protein